LIDRGRVVAPRASVDDVRCEGDTFGIEVGNCIPLALAFGIAEVVVVVVVGGCMARTTGQMEQLIQRHSIDAPILPRTLYEQRPYIELATFPSFVVYHQLLRSPLEVSMYLVASSMLEAEDMTDGGLSASSGRMAAWYYSSAYRNYIIRRKRTIGVRGNDPSLEILPSISRSLGVIGCTEELSPVKPDCDEAGEASHSFCPNTLSARGAAALGTDALLANDAGEVDIGGDGFEGLGDSE
jgi:hypothetical protein